MQNEDGSPVFTTTEIGQMKADLDEWAQTYRWDVNWQGQREKDLWPILRIVRGCSNVLWEREQEAQRRELVVSRPVRVDKDDSFVVAVPYDGFRISFTSINPHKLIGVQYFDIEVNEDSFYKEIAQARTIAYEKEIEALRNMGLGLGGTIDNVIVYNDEGWINPLHYDDELVRHKILDIIGDLRLAGLVKGHFIAVKSGHALNTAMAKLLLEEFK